MGPGVLTALQVGCIPSESVAHCHQDHAAKLAWDTLPDLLNVKGILFSGMLRNVGQPALNELLMYRTNRFQAL
ncbi:MAG: hypothetical protein MZV64_36950 [Ignavibacteriales bacterium]|nr:hypothetical protein [Ignavibacteriales bacterium]